MKFNRKNGLAIALIVIGALMLLGLFGPLFGKLVSLLFPLILIGLGYYGIKRGKMLIGWIVLTVGLLILIGRLAWLIGPILGILLLVFGIMMLKDKKRFY